MRFLGGLSDSGIKTISITEPAFNMEGEMSDLIRYILTWFNNFYLVQLKRNIHSGLDRARKQGKTLGRPPSGEFLRYKAFDLLFNQKLSVRQAAKLLNTNPSRVQRFKKVVEKNKDLFIKMQGCIKSGDSDT
jgi:DNA invertase Pin-like site-specific DNA recombinase